MSAVLAAFVLVASIVAAAPAAAAVPGAPTGVTAVADVSSATVSWAPPASDGGAPITGYVVTSWPDNRTATVDEWTFEATVTGLTNGRSYRFRVRAINDDGTGAYSAYSNTVMPVGPPSEPRSARVSAGTAAGSALVTWARSASTGGSAITEYEVTSSPDGISATVNGATFRATLTGLTTGTAYTFTVVARNDAGESDPSVASNALTLTGPPDAPGAVVATAGDGRATVTWAAPPNNGGAAISGYTVTSSPGAKTANVGANVLSTAVTGLTNGTAYTFTVVAKNARGSSAASAPSAAVTPVGVPGAPAGVTAVAGDRQATVSWTAASASGSPLTKYTVISSPGHMTATVAGNVLTATMTGLANGSSYTFTVKATNAKGDGPASAASGVITPSGPPGAPTGIAVTPGEQSATVSWTAAAGNGSPITDYTVTSHPGDISVTVPGTATSATVTGLSGGTSYSFTVTASNAHGTSDERWSGSVRPSGSVTPDPAPTDDTTTVAGVTRLAGSDRVRTAVAASQSAWATTGMPDDVRQVAGSAVLARSDVYADALAGTPLAVTLAAPLLLTPSAELPEVVLTELQRILPEGSVVYLLGGTAAIAPGVEAALTAEGFGVERYAGADRYATAVDIASRGLGNPAVQLLVTGLDFADALPAGAAAAAAGGCVLLTAGDQLPAATAAHLSATPGTQYAIGGAATLAAPSATAIAGPNRYDTAVLVARQFFAGPPNVGLGSGSSFPDALVGSAHIAGKFGPLLLTPPEALPASVTAYLQEHAASITEAFVYGGAAVVPDVVRDALGLAIT